MSGPFHSSDGPGAEGAQSDAALQPRNPLLCFICDDYYSEPCLLSCYHTFCSRCLRGRDVDGKLICPLCGQTSQLKEGTSLPPADMLMRQLIELSNAENPPCANCDKRDKASMYFCSTCGQALCSHCRENTHRAKMFSTHEVVHMSKCSKEGHRRCAVHGEQYIMFSNSQKNMLCVNCFRDTPAEARLHCVDIDTAYTQGCKKLDRAVLIRTTRKVAMWPVGLCTKFGLSTPIVANGTFKGFYDGWVAGRKFPVDMAGFAVSVEFLLKRPKASMPYKPGYEEDGFLKSLAPFEPSEIELKAQNCTKLLVWHTQTKSNAASAALDLTKYNNTNLVLLKQQIV